jgi:hypothetical protein
MLAVFEWWFWPVAILVWRVTLALAYYLEKR